MNESMKNKKRKEKFSKLSDEKKKMIIEWRLQMLEAYQLIITSMNHEDAYFSWIYGWIPDAPTEDDFISCANDYDKFEEQTQRFKTLMERFSDYGFVSPNPIECVADESASDYWKRVYEK